MEVKGHINRAINYQQPHKRERGNQESFVYFQLSLNLTSLSRPTLEAKHHFLLTHTPFSCIQGKERFKKPLMEISMVRKIQFILSLVHIMKTQGERKSRDFGCEGGKVCLKSIECGLGSRVFLRT